MSRRQKGSRVGPDPFCSIDALIPLRITEQARTTKKKQKTFISTEEFLPPDHSKGPIRDARSPWPCPPRLRGGGEQGKVLVGFEPTKIRTPWPACEVV